MAKSKGLDFKALLLNHGEKFGAAVVGLLALTGLATANWSGCKLLEAELKSIATKTRDTWSSPSNAWPEDKKTVFQMTPDVEGMAKRMASPNEDIEQFATVRHWNEPINQLREKLSAVVVLPPEFPESTLVEFTHAMKDDAVEGEETSTEMQEDSPETKSPDQQELDDLFGKTAAAGAPAGFPGAEGDVSGAFPGGIGPGVTGPGAGMGPGMMSGGMPGGAGPGGAAMGMGMGMGLTMSSGELGLDGYGGYPGGENGMSATPPERKVRSVAGVSVRCVFDLYKQTNMIAEALHLSEKEAGQRYVDFVNLEIQRKSAIAGPDPWAGEWEALPLKDIAEILDQSAYFDRDIVNPSVVRSEITMPLPSRAAGNWKPNNASHTRLENFQLSEEEKDLIDKHQAMLLEEATKRKAMLPPQQAKSEGFRKYTLASQDLGMTLGGAGYGQMAESIYSDYQGMQVDAAGESGKKKTDPRFKTPEELEKFLNSTLVANRLLLVRFMDFTCDRGNSYQYRVRLEMRNPNFNMPIDDLEQPELATQRTIFSDWSTPTTPVYVPTAYRYYAQKVESKPRADELAHLNMFYLHETAGTPVMANLRIPVGVKIGGRQLIEVVDLGKSTLENQEVELKSQDYLAGIAEAPRMSASDFPELKDYMKSLQGAKAVPDRITVVDSSGAIVNRFVGDKVTTGEKPVTEKDDARLVKYVLDSYQEFRPQDAEALPGSPYGPGGDASMMDPGAAMGAMSGMSGMGDSYVGKSGRGSALGSSSRNKGRSSSSSSSSSSSKPGGNPNR